MGSVVMLETFKTFISCFWKVSTFLKRNFLIISFSKFQCNTQTRSHDESLSLYEYDIKHFEFELRSLKRCTKTLLSRRYLKLKRYDVSFIDSFPSCRRFMRFSWTRQHFEEVGFYSQTTNHAHFGRRTFRRHYRSANALIAKPVYP